jgi:hypothetical protein
MAISLGAFFGVGMTIYEKWNRRFAKEKEKFPLERANSVVLCIGLLLCWCVIFFINLIKRGWLF